MRPIPFVALVKRELLSTLRGWRAPAIVAVSVAGFSILAIVLWPETNESLYWSAQISQRLVYFIAAFMFGACVLFVPALASGAIVLEREKDSYDLLALSLIRPPGIVTAKLLNAVGVFLLVLLALLPILGVTFFLVGIELDQLAQAALLIVITAVSCAMCGLVSSAYYKKSFTAIGGSYLGVLALMAGPAFVAFVILLFWFSFFPRGSVGFTLQQLYPLVSPIGAMAAIFQDDVGIFEFSVNTLYQLAFVAVCYRLTLRFLRTDREPPLVETEKPIDDAAVLAARRKTFPYYLIDPLKRKKPIEDGRNPMFVREMRWGLFSRGTLLVRVTYFAFGLYFFAGAISLFGGGSDVSMLGWMHAQLLITVFIAPALVSNALTKEYELGNVDMLRMTMLRPREIVLGKLLAAVQCVAPIIGAAVLSAFIVLALSRQQRDWGIVLPGYATMVLCGALSVTLGLWASLFTQRTSVALSVSYVLNILVFVAGPMVAEIVCGYWFSDLIQEESALWDDYLLPATRFLSPITAYRFAATVGEGTVWLPYWLLNMAVFGLLALILAEYSVRFFAKRRMRDR